MKRMLRSALPAVVLAIAAPSAAAEAVKISSKFPFADASTATDAVKNECQLETNLPQYVANAAGKLAAVSENPGQGGRVLQAKITHVLAPGGGAFSGPKSVAAEGQLLENGKVVASFTGRRNTTGGGYGTCAMLNHAARAVGKDIAKWLKEPAMDAKLGDAK